MASRATARTTTRRIRIRWTRVVVLLAAVATTGVVVGSRLPPPSSTNALPHVLRGHQPRALGDAGGALPDGVTVFAGEYPAVAKLDPALLDALRRAATAAADDGVELRLDSGWRSPAYQAQLLDEAIAKYGSAKEAARWVATPSTSAHVSGDAVDVGPSDATAWLSEHGAAYGLCQIYGNEPWHYELRPRAVGQGCPRMYADATHDPRTQQPVLGSRSPQVPG